MGAAVVGMELVALIVAVSAFGWPVMLVGAPLFVGTLVVLVVVKLWEVLRRRLERRQAEHWDQPAALPGGLMSGFFEVSAVGEQPPLPPVEVPPILRAARGWAEGAARQWVGSRAGRSGVGALRGWVAGARPRGARAAARRPGARPRTAPRVLALSERLPRRMRELRRPRR